MTSSTNGQPTVVRTGRGLSIAGTRITLYTILEYLHADWPPKLIQDWLDLTDAQMADVLAYIDEHRDQVEQEYQLVLARAEEVRQYWDAQAQQHLAERPVVPLTPEQRAIREKFQVWKARRRTQ